MNLSKLPPGDEVAILGINDNDDVGSAIRNGKAIWLTDFTRDRAQIEKGLARIPALMAEPPKEPKKRTKIRSAKSSGSLSISTDTNGNATQSAEAKPKDDVLEIETIKGKNGAVITRTTKKDGSQTLSRVSSSGKVNVVLDNVYDIAGATRDATRFAEEKRPKSQAAIVWVSDGIAPIFKEDVNATGQILIRQNAIFNSLNVDMKTIYKFLLPLGQPLIGWTGISLAGSARQLAQQSGGESVHVSRVKRLSAPASRG